MLLGGTTIFALFPAIAAEGSPEAVNNKPFWLVWVGLAAFVCAGIGLFLLIRADGRVHDNGPPR
jgi:hypothetical protein